MPDHTPLADQQLDDLHQHLTGPLGTATDVCGGTALRLVAEVRDHRAAQPIALPARWECSHGPSDDEPYCAAEDGHVCPTIRVHPADATAFAALVAAATAPGARQAAAFLEAADIAEEQRQFEPAFGARKAAQISENVGILRVAEAQQPAEAVIDANGIELDGGDVMLQELSIGDPIEIEKQTGPLSPGIWMITEFVGGGRSRACVRRMTRDEIEAARRGEAFSRVYE